MKIDSYLVKEAFEAEDWSTALDILIQHFGLHGSAKAIKESELLFVNGYWDAIFIYTDEIKYSWLSTRGASSSPNTSYRPYGGFRVLIAKGARPSAGPSKF